MFSYSEFKKQVLNRTLQHFGDWKIDSRLSRSRGAELSCSAGFITSDMTKMLALLCSALRHTRSRIFPQPVTTAGDNTPNKDLTVAKGYRGMLQPSCPHLWIDHTSLSAIWPLNTQGSFRRGTEATTSPLWSSEMFFHCEGAVARLRL